MAREIARRLKIKGKFEACGPLHVGGIGRDVDTDLALAVNGRGKLYAPGTSLAGPIRAWLRRHVDEEIFTEKSFDDLWGFQKKKENGDNEGQASLVIVEDGRVKLPASSPVEIRDGVGINRVTGAAAEGMKYDRAVLPRGSTIEFSMIVELDDEADAPRKRAAILAAIQALQRGEIRFGAAKTRGMGKVTLNELDISEQNLSSFEGMLEALRGRGESLDINNMSAQALRGYGRLDIKIDWEPRGPLMVKAERDGMAVDMLPLVSAAGDSLTFVLPGSSIKGTLRSRAEFIARTLLKISAPNEVKSRNAFMKQIELRTEKDEEEGQSESSGTKLICGMFGAASRAEGKSKTKEKNEDDEDEEGNHIPDHRPPLPGLAALTIEDCYADTRTSFDHWSAIELATDDRADGGETALQKALGEAGLQKKLQQAFHVAIDRWTGGAADGFLYTALEPRGVDWEPIRMTLDLSRLPDEIEKPAVACLLLVLRDMVEGRIPLGFATNRGMGAIRVTGLEIAPINLYPDDVLNVLNDLRNVAVTDGKLGGWGDELKEVLNNAWRDWYGPTIEGADE